MYRTLFLLTAAALAVAAQTPERKTAEEVYKNIVALKGTPADQLGATMQMMAASLGVNCQFCHVQGKMDADDKGAKRTARNMIAMTMAINKDNFHGQVQVSCYTCHRGSARPVSVPQVQESDTPAKTAEAMPAGGGRGGARPNVEEAIEKYVAAVGGADAMHKIASRKMTGKILANGSEQPITVLTKAPNRRITITQMGGSESMTAFDGTAGWMGSTGRPARPMSAEESASAALDAEFYPVTRIKEMYSRVMAGRPETIDGVECQSVTASAPGKPMVRLYFDAKTGLLVRMVRLSETPVGRMPVQIDYADYREKDGVKIPYRWTLSRPNGRFTIQIDQVEDNAPIDDAKFAPPEK
jgi:hypothetical protein